MIITKLESSTHRVVVFVVRLELFQLGWRRDDDPTANFKVFAAKLLNQLDNFFHFFRRPQRARVSAIFDFALVFLSGEVQGGHVVNAVAEASRQTVTKTGSVDGFDCEEPTNFLCYRGARKACC